MDPSAAARREAERWMGVAEKLLMARDLAGCKQFVSQALAADSRSPGSDDLLAAADVLLAAQPRSISSGHADPYAVLGIDSALPASRDPDVIHSHYRRLSLLLNRSHPDRPCSLAFAEAGRLIADAWAFLSDPLRKATLDSDLDAAAAATAASATRVPSAPSPEQRKPQPTLLPHTTCPTPPSQPRRPSRQPQAQAAATPPSRRRRPPRPSAPQPQPQPGAPQSPTFWTVCPACCHVHQYDRFYEARTLLCPSCRRPFFSAAMPTLPPIVPGTDMYYCTWGFFPLGFPGGPGLSGMVNLPTQQSSAAGIHPMGSPYMPLPIAGGGAEGHVAAVAGSGTVVGAPLIAVAASAPTSVESKHIKVGARKRGRPKGSKNKNNNVVIEIN